MGDEGEKEILEEYAYLDRGGFSSEKFKIELRGLPKFYGIAIFQELVRRSELQPFSPADFSGHWRYLTVRHSMSTGEIMLIVAMHPQELSTEQKEQIQKELVEHLSNEESAACGIKSLYIERVGDEATRPVHLWGSTHIVDTILGRHFRISPEAFFQINTAGADILYQRAIDMSQVKEDSTVVDICCGTGTIGLCFAKHCGQVLGLELVPEAVRDAKANAEANGITNCDLFAGRAEDILPSVLARATAEDVVAIDMHADVSGRLVPDSRQDCEGFQLDSATRSIVFERHFDTCDDNDYIIEDGTVHVVWARGSDKLFSSQGLCLPCTSTKNHGFIRVRLLTPLTVPKPEGTQLHFHNQDLKVPAGDTTYWCKVIKLPEAITEKMHHITQFESAITKGNEGLVHHMELFYCDEDSKKDIPLYNGNCFAPDRPEITKKCTKVKSAWAMGARPFTYPAEAGLPLGGPAANKYVMLEVHYNNPELRNDWVDSSGIILHVTPNRRRYDAAIMELGLEYTDKMAIPAGQDAFPLTAYCVPQCTGVGLPAGGITVFGSQLHTHLTGVAAWTRHARGGRELPALNRDLHYSTHFQEIRLLHTPVTVLPGDFLETTCIHRTLDRANATIGGHAITDEMCVNYMHYYPATELEVCKSAVSNAASERALGNPIESGKIKSFCRAKGHGFVIPEKSGEDIFVHISESERALGNPIESGKIKSFCRAKGHGFVIPEKSGEDIFVHISDIEGEYVPLPGDEVIYRLCPIPPKFEKYQAVHVRIVHLTPEKHLKWDEPPL
ncbi:hypothetical protein MSG28_010390 [Choristoneura fumiferana]|uniref:Uncharacterized protein n=2 Tax=Choristoneura fumiferana TaxID=7141 RepID=A0ACC0KL12_CHOFU|nr:hypothetical protein MSG28_010390 [Choristoneura fumiferana]KAI8436988.1 hypothetical protein MSG28_010390 [Choristoneura fumiferana]